MTEASGRRDLSARDAAAIWHPYTQMQLEPLAVPIVRGEGARLFDADGRRYIDAISSWWVNLHGHAHPHIAEAVSRQAAQLEHVIFAGFTHEPAVRLAERLLEVLPSNQARVFFSDNGSTAVEAALKMAIQYWANRGETRRRRIVTFEGGYHGDTFGAMAAGKGAFADPFAEYLFEVTTIPVPTAGNENRALAAAYAAFGAEDVSAFVYEPLVQGAGGMIMYAPQPLDDILAVARRSGALCIADEVMTGFGRTGKLWASSYLETQPDIVCLSKGITGGFMALGATSATKEIYEAFLSSDRRKMFFHGHSYTANPLACAAGNASLDLLLTGECRERIDAIGEWSEHHLAELRALPRMRNARRRGTISAFEVEDGGSYFSSLRDELYRRLLDRGVLIRPLGNTLYVLPPYCISEAELAEVFSALRAAVS